MDDRQDDAHGSPGEPILKSASCSALESPWQAGFTKHLPWTGLLSLFVALVCMVGAIVVAQTFDDKPINHLEIDDTVVQPAVLLSILATLSKTCIGYAFTSGIAIFWWKTALHGTTLRQLQTSQQQSSSLRGLYDRRPVLNRVTMASVAMLLLLAVGPFLQRALTVVTRIRNESNDLVVPVSSSPIMYGSTGLYAGFNITSYPILYHPLFAQILRQYEARDDITLQDFECHGTCTTDLVASGWDIECTSNTTEYRLTDEDEYDLRENSTPSRTWTGTPSSQMMFSTEVVYQMSPAHTGTNYQIVFNTKRKVTAGLRGEIQLQSCTLSEALVHYRVSINDRIVVLPGLPQKSTTAVQRIERREEEYDWPSTVGGLWLALKNKFAAEAYLFRTQDGFDISTNDTIASMYIRGQDPSIVKSDDITWDDPMNDMISMLQELTFRTAVATTSQGPILTLSHVGSYTYDPTSFGMGVLSPNLSETNRTVQQQVTVFKAYNETVFTVNYAWLFGGSSLIALAGLAIAPLYWGWWHLGRPVSLSPLEIAKAFDAPLLQAVDANGTSEELTKAIGDLRVRYGFRKESTGRDQRGESFEMDPIHAASTNNSLEPAVSPPVSLNSTDTARDRLLDEHSVLTETDEVDTIDHAVSWQQPSAYSVTAPHSADNALPGLTDDTHTVTTGLLPSTAAAVAASSSLLWHQARPTMGRQSLKFREENFGAGP